MNKSKEVAPPITLKISKAPAKLLKSFMAEPKFHGRFYELKADVLASIKGCPRNQIRIITPTKEMKASKYERTKISLALTKNLKQVGWKIRYSTPQEVFYVFPTSLNGQEKHK